MSTVVLSGCVNMSSSDVDALNDVVDAVDDAVDGTIFFIHDDSFYGNVSHLFYDADEGLLYVNGTCVGSAAGGNVFDQDLNTSGSPTFNGLTLSELTPGEIVFPAADGSLTGNSSLFFGSATGRLGIGTSSPRDLLHIQATGNCQARMTSGATSLSRMLWYNGDTVGGYFMARGDTQAFSFVARSGYSINFFTTDSSGKDKHRLFIPGGTDIPTAILRNINFNVEGLTKSSLFYTDYANDSIGIGLSNPAYTFDVDGAIHGTDYYSSDGSLGWTGTFTNGDGKTVTVKNGLITGVS